MDEPDAKKFDVEEHKVKLTWAFNVTIYHVEPGNNF